MDAARFASSFVPLWVGDRGEHPDFVRFGAWVACDAAGRRVAGAGDATLPAFLRSSAKPFQVLAFLRRGLDERLALGPVEVACACASHEGEPAHVAAARRILAAGGIDEAALRCGTHPAGNAELERQVARGEATLAPIHNNCSGKHSAMLATCREEGWALETYTERDHPLQVENLATLATFAGMMSSDIIVGTDNCTVPTFALPLEAAARAFARLIDPRGVPEPLARAASRAFGAMTAQPFMVGGTGRLDTLLMERTGGRVMVKTGANGFHGGCGRRSDGAALGFALKLSGAEGEAQKAPAVIHALLSCGLLLADEARDLLARFATPQLNCRGAIVGGGTPVS